MLKPVIAAAAALAVVGSSLAYAQHRSDGPGGFDGPRHARPSIDDIKAFTDARIAALKAGLQLTPDQEKNWPSFEQALRDLAKLRLDRIQARMAAGAQQPDANPFDRLQHRADTLAQFGVALKRVADAGAPLYQSFSDAQKHRFRILAHVLRPHPMAGGFFWHRHEFGREDGRGGPGGPNGFFGRHDGRPHGMMGRDRNEDSHAL